MNESERVFDLGPSFFENLRRVTWLRAVPVIFVALGAALFFGPPGITMDPGLRAAVACVLFPAGLFGAWRGYRRQVASFQGFRLVVEPGAVRRIQPGLPDMEIARGEVRRIVEAPGKGLTVLGPGHQQFITVPHGLNGFDEARALLAAWSTPEIRTSALAQWYPALAGLLTVTALALVVGSSDRTVVTGCGVALIAALLYSMLAVRNSPHVDPRARKMMWLMPVIVVLVALRIWAVWQP
jgi:hypothetical protein